MNVGNTSKWQDHTKKFDTNLQPHQTAWVSCCCYWLHLHQLHRWVVGWGGHWWGSCAVEHSWQWSAWMGGRWGVLTEVTLHPHPSLLATPSSKAASPTEETLAWNQGGCWHQARKSQWECLAVWISGTVRQSQSRLGRVAAGSPSPQKYSPNSMCLLLQCKTWSQEGSLVPCTRGWPLRVCSSWQEHW